MQPAQCMMRLSWIRLLFDIHYWRAAPLAGFFLRLIISSPQNPVSTSELINLAKPISLDGTQCSQSRRGRGGRGGTQRVCVIRILFMKSKYRKSYIGFVVACVLIMVGVIVNAGYRFWMIFTTDWREVFQQMRPVDYLITLMALTMFFAINRLFRSKP